MTITTAERSAADAGITLAEYHGRIAAGEKWCRAHRQWHAVAEFGTDPKGERGLARSCRASRRAPAAEEPDVAARHRGRGGSTRPARRHLDEVPRSPALPTRGAGARAAAAGTARTVAWSLAACRGVDPELFFPASTTGPGARQAAAAAAVCAGCPIREGCLRTALTQGEEFGVFGGLTEDQRAQLRAEQARAS